MSRGEKRGTALKFDDWPFLPSEARSLEDNERWWNECYLSSRNDNLLQGQAHWRIILGGPGSGKSTILEALARRVENDSLILRYPSESWPGMPKCLKRDSRHLGQIMTLASRAIREHLAGAPDKLLPMSKTQREFLRWLIEKFNGTRAYFRWLDGLGDANADCMSSIAYDNLYPTEIETLDVQGQTEELLGLCRRIGYQRILILADVYPISTDSQMLNLRDLFSWLELMHHSGLDLVAGVPSQFWSDDLLARTRGRVGVMRLQWSRDDIREIASRHISAATKGVQRIERLASSELLQRLVAMLDAEFEQPAPKGGVGLARVLLTEASRVGEVLNEGHYADVVRAFFAAFMPLRIEATPMRRGVWRGPRFIPLDEQPFNLLRAFCQNPGMMANSEGLTLLEVAGSKSNLHTLVRRLRKAIEPIPSSPIYIKNHRREGYYIEHLEKV